MLRILLLILKALGILLLAVLGLLLLVTVLILITPFRYRVEASYQSDIRVLVKFHFWFSLFAAFVQFQDKKLKIYLRIFGIKKYLVNPDIPKKEGEKLPDKSEQEDEWDENPDEEELSTEEADTENEIEEFETIEEAKDDGTDAYSVRIDLDQKDAKQQSSVEETTGSENTASDGQKEKPGLLEGLLEKLLTLLDFLSEKYNGVSEKILLVKEKIISIREKVDSTMKTVDIYLEFLKKTTTQGALKAIKKQLIKVLHSVLPRKFSGRLKLGLDNPQTMGTICMYAGILHPFYSKHFELEPVFDEKVIDGKIALRGRFILGAILGHILALLFVKDVRRCIRDVFRILKKNKARA